MVSLGRTVDRVVGGLSRLLYMRGAQLNTVDDLGPYLDASRAILFPQPVVPRDLTRKRVRTLRVTERAVERLAWHSAHVPLCPHYRARHAGEYAPNQRASARWLHPTRGRRTGALVYVHGWLEPAPWQAIFLPRLYDALGVDVLHLQLPFHGTRNPRTSLFHGEFFWTADLVRSLEAIRQSCLDARTLVAWLRAEGYREVGVTGISTGASVAMVLACLEPLPDYIVPIIGHLQLAEALEDAPIFWRMRSDLERFGIDRQRRQDVFARLGLQHLAPKLPRERQLWIMARDDVYIPAPLVERQWRGWGEPPIEWLPGGHMTFALSLPRIVERMRDFHDGLASESAGPRSLPS
ncbi:MAG: alpha/beta hydrolase family protein [Polyangiaceae bacterium]|nr:alpha/beta hydrolase family protein [Polyangiaceae bacterium]